MMQKNQYNKSKKKAVSGFIVTIIMVALVMTLALIVWGAIKNMVEGGLEDVESCFGVFEQVTINNMYTCYNATSNEFQFSISIGEIDVDEVIVLISGEGTTKSFKLNYEGLSDPNLKPYPIGSYGSTVFLPEKNSGLTYVFDMTGADFLVGPDMIKITPVIDGKKCEVSDSLQEIDDCSLLA